VPRRGAGGDRKAPCRYKPACCSSQQKLDTKNREKNSKEELKNSVVRKMRLTILNRRQVIQRISRALFIKERDVIVNLSLDGFVTSHMQIHEQLSLDPAVDRLHGGIVGRCTGTRHGMRYAVHGKQIIEGLGSIDRTLIRVKNHLVFGMLLFQRNQII